MTDEEKKVWYQILKGHVPKFHRQRIIGNYIVDFFCPKLKLIIEIDGYQHFYEENKEYDNKRTEYLEKLGFFVLRFENTEVDKDIENVKYIINNVCNSLEKGGESLLNIDSSNGECITIESDDSTTFEGSRRELSTARKTSFQQKIIGTNFTFRKNNKTKGGPPLFEERYTAF